MKFKFSKYHGAGNDFILSDDLILLGQDEDKRVKIITALCDRRLGIGADGLMLVEKNKAQKLKIFFFNSDGKAGSLCGNGSRCALSFAIYLGFINSGSVDFFFWDNMYQAKIGDDGVKIKMKDINIRENTEFGFFTDTGSPHLIKELDHSSLNKDILLKEALYLRHHPFFQKRGGTNINFIKLQPTNKYQCQVLTFERGVEDFTFACGTGAVAIAGYLAWKSQSGGVYEIISEGGTLEVEIGGYLENLLADVWLSGPVKFVFEGQLDLFTFLGR